MKHKVFVYGNLMQGMPLYSSQDGVTILGEGTIQGTLYFANYPLVILGGTSLVYGEVHEVGEKTLQTLDYIENIKAHAADPTWYKRLTCTVTMDTGRVHENVWIYAPLKAWSTWQVIPNGSYRRYRKGDV